MISGSSHLVCRVVDGIVRRLLVLNLGRNLALGLGFRLYSTQEHNMAQINQVAMHNQHDARQVYMMHFMARDEAHKNNTKQQV